VRNEFNLPAYHQLNIKTSPLEAFEQLNINTIKVNENNFEGYYFESVPIKFKVKPLKGYIFSHWEQQNGKQIFTDSIETDLKENSEFTAIYFPENQKNNILVFPNPSPQGNIYIRLVDDIKSLKKIAIVNLLGETVYTNAQPKISGEYTLVLETNLLNQGIYYVHIDLIDRTEVIKLMIL
jgi:hypothetical protein